MKQKTRKLSIRAKIIIVCVILFVTAVFLLGITFVNRSKKDMTAMGVEQAKIAARIAANQVDGDVIKALKPGEENSEGYQTQLKKLLKIKEACGVEYMYVIYTDNNKLYYSIDTDDRAVGNPVIGQEFEMAHEDLAHVFAGEEYVDEFIAYTEYGDLISAYEPIYDSTGQVVAVLGSDYNAALVVERLDSVKKSIVLLGVVSFIVAYIIIFFAIGQCLRGLKVVNGKIYDLVHSEGDLTKMLDVHSGDELELMANNVNEMLAYIREIMLKISDNSKRLNESAQIVAGKLLDAGDDVTDVSANMEEMSASVEEITASVNQVTESIENIFERINDIAAKAQQGNANAEEIAAKANNLHADAELKQMKAQEMAEKMTVSVNQKIEQSKSVEEINTLTENILSIAAQTNMLALNASIEAARAGEAGRGFAVVASEIGQLATNSAETASRIKEVSSLVIASVEGLAEEAENMVQFVEETALGGYRRLLEASEDYSRDAENIHTTMQDFAEHAQNLGEVMDSIKEAVVAVNCAMEENAKGVVGVAETATTLSATTGAIADEAEGNRQIAEVLEGEVGKFKLS